MRHAISEQKLTCVSMGISKSCVLISAFKGLFALFSSAAKRTCTDLSLCGGAGICYAVKTSARLDLACRRLHERRAYCTARSPSLSLSMTHMLNKAEQTFHSPMISAACNSVIDRHQLPLVSRPLYSGFLFHRSFTEPGFVSASSSVSGGV